MTGNTKKVSLLIIAVIYLFCISCAGPAITITEDTIYDQPIAESKSEYILGPGDTIEITYFFGTRPSEKEYILEVGDVIDVEFYYHPEINKKVIVRPDGKITLARKGDIHAAGITTLKLKENIAKLYSDDFKDPSVSIILIEFNQALKGFKEAIASDRSGHGKSILIQPDGYISLYHLEQDVRAAGFTLPQLKTIISEEYNKIFDSITISLTLENSNSNLAYVSGEVRSPASYKLIGPTTVTQILSQAGIIWETAKLSSVLVISRSPDGRPMGRLVNLNKVIGEGNIGHDIMLKRFDIVYVPRNAISNANLFVEQYINRIIPNNIRMSFTYRLDSKTF